MMTDTNAHLDDGELMVLDDAAREHVASCAQCAERLRVLNQYSNSVSSLIAEIDVPDDFRYPSLPAAPQVRAIQPWYTQQQWRRAAAVIFVIGALAAVPPVRAWAVGLVKKGIAALTGANRHEAPRVAQPVEQKVAPIDSGATLWFDADGPELAVEISSSQASGTLTFTSSPRSMTGIEVVNGAGETPLVREHGVRLINGRSSTASYRLAVPSNVQQIRVRIGNQPWQTFGRSDVDAGRSIELR